MRNNFKATVLVRPDVLEFLALLDAYRVRYLIIGGCAVIYYTGRRYTTNVDIWIAKDRVNVTSLVSVLKAFGAPLTGLCEDDFIQEGHFYQMGIPPVHIDDMLSLRGIMFEDAWAARRIQRLDGLRLPFIGINHLIKSKLASGRSQDIVDVNNIMRKARSR